MAADETAIVTLTFDGQVVQSVSVVLQGVPPSVSLVTASNVSPTGATLSATVNPNGAPTMVAFQYGTTTDYGAMTPAQDVGSGMMPELVTASVTDLTPGSSYHVRAVATQ